MSKRFALPMLALIVMLAALPAVALAAPAGDPPTPEQCRRLYGTDDWTRRCRQLSNEFDPIAYCRRVYGTDEWTRRCRQLSNDFDPIAYCRRVYGTDEWTRRCRNLQTDTMPVPVRPRVSEPTVLLEAGPLVTAPVTRPAVRHP